MNKIIAFLLVLTLIGCGTAKPKAKSTKKPHVIASTQPKRIKRIVEEPVDVIIIDQKEKIELLEATSKIKVTKEIVLAYINQFKGVAKEDMKEYGVPASITLAQGILESGAGTGLLCKLANNHFGIKCHKEWTGPYVRYDDDAAQECFRKYEHAEQSYKDHSAFLTTRAWYKPLFKLSKSDYKAWAKGLKKAGYATDPKYPDKLIGLIERYQLQQYDAEVLGIDYMPTNVSAEKKVEKNEVPSEQEHIVSPGDTLYSISKKYSISVDSLKVKNNLSENAISIGQKLIVK